MLHNPNLRAQHEAGEVIHLANIQLSPKHPPTGEEPAFWDDAPWAAMPARIRGLPVSDFVKLAEYAYGVGTVSTGNALDPETKTVIGLPNEVGVYVETVAFTAVAKQILFEQEQSAPSTEPLF